MKTYKNKGFEDKIQINLANICKGVNDTFKFVKALYVVDFTCELCEHQHLSKAYRIQNLNTGKMIDVGCECITHFGLSQSDIDLAEAMMKRVEKSIKAGRDMLVKKYGEELFNTIPENERPRSLRAREEKIEELGNEYLKSLPKSEKTPLFVRAYRMHEAELLMEEVGGDRHILTNEEVTEILELGYKDKMDAAMSRQENARKEKARQAFRNKTYNFLASFRQNLVVLSDADVADMMDEAVSLDIEAQFRETIERHNATVNNEIAFQKEYNWVLSYDGDNSFLRDLKNKLSYWRSLTPAQVEAGKKVLDSINNPPPPAPAAAPEEPSIALKLSKLLVMFPNNTFYRSLSTQMQYRSLSAKQIDCIEKDYSKKCLSTKE